MEAVNEAMIDLLSLIETQEEFEVMVANLHMLWTAKDTAKAASRGAPVSTAKN